MTAPRVAICDDEPSQLDILERCIENCEFWKDLRPEVARFAAGRELVRAVERGADFSYIFLDVQMPRENGIEICRQINAIRKLPVIFVSTHMESQPDVDALHPAMLLSKPYTADNLNNLLKAYKARREAERLFICKTAGGETSFAPRKILYIKGARGCNEVYVRDKPAAIIIFDRTLKQIASDFDDQGFFQSHKSHIINLRYYGRHTFKTVFLRVDGKDIELPLTRDPNIGRVMTKKHLALFGG